MALEDPLEFIGRHLFQPLTLEAEDARAIDSKANEGFKWNGRSLTLEVHLSDVLLSLCGVIFAPLVFYYIMAQRKIEMLPKYRAVVTQLDKAEIAGKTPDKVNAAAVRAINNGFVPTFENSTPNEIFRYALQKNNFDLAKAAFDLILDPNIIQEEYKLAFDERIYLKLLLHAHQLGVKTKGEGIWETPSFRFLANLCETDIKIIHDIRTHQSTQRMQYLRDVNSVYLTHLLSHFSLDWLRAIFPAKPGWFKQTFKEFGKANLGDYINELNKCDETIDESERGDEINIMHYAASFGWSRKAFRFLIDSGGDIHSRDRDGLTPLHWACGSGHLDTVKFLLEQKANLHAVTSLASKRRPIFLATINGRENVVDYLLKNHNPQGLSLGEMAVEDDNLRVLKELVEKGRTDLVKEGPALWNLARSIHAESCMLFLDNYGGHQKNPSPPRE